jgi:hypothetical protein
MDFDDSIMCSAVFKGRAIFEAVTMLGILFLCRASKGTEAELESPQYS